MLRCYISRVENGHTVPALETLEKLARALETPLYQLFYEGEEPPQLALNSHRRKRDWASEGKGYRTLRKFQQALTGMTESQRKVLLSFAGELTRSKHKEEAKSDLANAQSSDVKKNRGASSGG